MIGVDPAYVLFSCLFYHTGPMLADPRTKEQMSQSIHNLSHLPFKHSFESVAQEKAPARRAEAESQLAGLLIAA